MHRNQDERWQNRRKLPSLMAIRAFDAASRHGSFTKAAEELALTQSAISRHIKHLEQDVGIALFERHGRAVALTQAGEQLKEVVVSMFDYLTAGLNEVRATGTRRSFRISALPSVAARWLAPLLARLATNFPEIDFNIHCSRTLVDFNRDSVDLALRYGTGDWPKMQSELLLREQIMAVCSPTLLADLGRSIKPEDLPTLPLIHGDIPDGWAQWFSAAGLQGINLPRGAAFSDDNALIQSAVEGQGIILARSALIAREIAERRLIEPFHTRLPATYSYWLVTSKEQDRQTRDICAFLQHCAEQDRDANFLFRLNSPIMTEPARPATSIFPGPDLTKAD